MSSLEKPQSPQSGYDASGSPDGSALQLPLEARGVDQPVFVSHTGRRPRALRLAGLATAMLLSLWIAALAAGVLGFEPFPGTPFPGSGSDSNAAETPPDRAGAPEAATGSAVAAARGERSGAGSARPARDNRSPSEGGGRGSGPRDGAGGGRSSASAAGSAQSASPGSGNSGGGSPSPSSSGSDSSTPPAPAPAPATGGSSGTGGASASSPGFSARDAEPGPGRGATASGTAPQQRSTDTGTAAGVERNTGRSGPPDG